MALVSTSFLLLLYSKALVTTSVALVSTDFSRPVISVFIAADGPHLQVLLASTGLCTCGRKKVQDLIMVHRRQQIRVEAITTSNKKLLGAPGLTTSNKKLLGAPGIATSNKKLLGLLALLLGAPGIATSNKKLLGAPVLTTRSKDATRGSWHRY